MLAFVLLLCFLAAVYLAVSGAFRRVLVRHSGSPWKTTIKVAYKYSRGKRSNDGPFFEELRELCPAATLISVDYSPNNSLPTNRRWIVGIILSANDSLVPEYVTTVIKRREYSFCEFPAIENALMTTFKNATWLSPYLGRYKAYEALDHHSKETSDHGLPLIEIRSPSEIHYVIPLEKNEQFFVPEVPR